jgi:2-methylcitrate dehydratase PrpD
MMNYTERLAAYAAAAYDRLPESVVSAGRRLVKDTLACAVAGVGIPSSEIVTKVVGGYGGTPEATVLVSGQKLPAPLAAHINGHYSNAIDSDDTIRYKAHVAAAVIPPALAMAEREGSSGKDFLMASIMGYEVASRVAMSLKSLAVSPSGELQFGMVSGYSGVVFGAAVAAGRLLGLDAQQMRICPPPLSSDVRCRGR